MLRFPGGAFRREDLDQTSSVGTYVTFFKQSRGGGGPESRENRGKDKEVKGRKREDTGGLESKNQRQTDRWKKERRRVWERAAERGRQGGNGGRGKGEGEGLSKKMMGEEMREQRKQGAGEGMKPDGNTRAAGRERRGEGAPPFYQPLSPTEGGSGSESQGRHSAQPGAPSPRADTVQRPGLASLAGRGGRPVTWTGSPRWAAAPPPAGSPGSRSSSSSPWRGGRRAGRPERLRGGRAEGGGRSAGGTRGQAGAGPAGRPEAAMFPQRAPRGLPGGGPLAPLGRAEKRRLPCGGSGRRGDREPVERGHLLAMESVKGTLGAQGPGPEGGGEQTGRWRCGRGQGNRDAGEG